MKKIFLFFTFFLAGQFAFALAFNCDAHFVQGKAPEFITQKLAVRAVPLCFESYAVMHSGLSRTPLWAAEHLTADHIVETEMIKRHNTFHSESRLPADDRAELKDYAHSGYDRGHMAPSGDMPNKHAQYESFSLANMIPQNPNNNQNLWAGIEDSVRKFAKYRGELYVITGPIFDGASVERINFRVLVPSQIFKAIYDPVGQAAAAYIAPNARGSAYQVISIADLEKRTGINLFPALDARSKAVAMELPEPRPHGRKLR